MANCKWCGKFLKKATRKPFKYCPPPATCKQKWQYAATKGAQRIRGQGQ